MVFPVIDAHQHIWDPSRAEYAWLGDDLAVINKTFMFEDVLPELTQAGINFTVQVQSADNSEDTQLMLESALANPEVAGIVGYVPLENPKKVAETLDTWIKDELFVGVRNLIHTQADPEWLLRPDVNEGLGVLEDYGFTFDLVAVYPLHLGLVTTLSERHPNLKIVIDHLGKPPIGVEGIEKWGHLLQAASQNPLVSAKVSGLYSATSEMSNWTTDQLKPFFDYALEIFGAERLMYGGDWPISLLAGGYTKVWNGLQPLIFELSDSEKEHILGRSAYNFYGLSPTRLGLSGNERSSL